MEARIQELTKTRTEAVRESIEKSIIDLRQRKKGLEEKQTFVLDAIRQTESILKNQEDQFTRYSRWIRKVLDQTGEGLKLGIQGLISRLLSDGHGNETGSLRGCPERASSRSVRLCSPGPTESERARGAPRAYRGRHPSAAPCSSCEAGLTLEGLYSKRHLSVREIARLADASRSTVLEALDRFGIPRNEERAQEDWAPALRLRLP